jgi:hypothetical protein
MQQEEEKLSELLAKYKDAKDAMETQEKKMEKYRKKIETRMTLHGLDKFDDGQWQIRKQVQQRMLFSKKQVPLAVWKEYATPHKVEFFVIRDKKKNKK